MASTMPVDVTCAMLVIPTGSFVQPPVVVLPHVVVVVVPCVCRGCFMFSMFLLSCVVVVTTPSVIGDAVPGVVAV